MIAQRYNRNPVGGLLLPQPDCMDLLRTLTGSYRRKYLAFTAEERPQLSELETKRLILIDGRGRVKITPLGRVAVRMMG